METASLRHDLLELLLLLSHLNPLQFQTVSQFGHSSSQGSYDTWIPNLVPLLQKLSPSQIQQLKNIVTKQGEEQALNQQLSSIGTELAISPQDLENLRGSFELLVAIYLLQRLLQSFSILQLMKMFEIMPPGPPVQQLQLLQQIQQLFSELKVETLLNLHKKIQEAQPGKEQQTLIGLLDLSSDFFQLYQPLRLLLQLDTDELTKLKQVLPQLEPKQILQLLHLLQWQPFEVLELRNLLNPSENNTTTQEMTTELQPSISQTPMDDAEPESDDKGVDLHLQIVEQPPEKSVYKRNLKPNPIVMLVGDQKLNDGNLYVVPTLVRCGSFIDEPKYLTGNRPVKVTSGRVLTFRKLKVTTTSHQQQETLFCIKFELRKYSGEDEYTVLDSVHSTPVCVLSHSTQMKPVPNVVSVITEVIPNFGHCEGGTRVAILGSSFVDNPAARVRFDTTDVMPTFHGPCTLLCYTPSHAPGTVSVKVSNSAKKWSETQASFTYHDYFQSYQNKNEVGISLSPSNHFDGVPPDWPGNGSFEPEDSSEGGFQFNGMDSRGFNALHYASAQGDIQKTLFLVNHGVDVNFVDKFGNNALFWASSEGHVSIVKYLLEHGSKISSNFENVTPLFAAVNEGNEEVTSLLLQHGSNVNITTVDGYSPLHQAAVCGNINILHALIEGGAFLNIQDEEGDTALHWAIRERCLEAAKSLIEKGIALEMANDDGETALHLAVMENVPQIVELLIQKGSPIDVKDTEGVTPLHLAIQTGNEKLVQIIITHGPNVNAQDNYGQTALHMTLNQSIQSLLMSHGAQTDVKDKYGKTPKLSSEKKRKEMDSCKYPFAQKAVYRLSGNSFSFVDV